MKDLTDKGVDARYKVCDVSKLEDVKALADYAWDEFNGLCRCSCLKPTQELQGNPDLSVDLSEENYCLRERSNVYDINVFGILNGIWSFGKRMVEQVNTGDDNKC